MSAALAAMVALGLAAFSVVRGTWAVGGSDSSCYALMAKAFARGELQPATPLAIEAPWPNALLTFAPGGFVPSTLAPDAAAPICAPGFSVLMTPLAAAFGQDAIFWLPPLAAAALVMAVFVMARRLGGGAAGVVAAILVATSPVVLFQAVQPMNDVTTAALWMLALAFAPRGGLSGVCAGVAILVRPNLAPLAIPVVLMVMLYQADAKARWRSLAAFTIAAVPPLALLLWLNASLYGGPFVTGYGSPFELFAVGNIQQNLTNYGRAIVDTQYAIPLIAVLAPLVLPADKKREALLLILFAAVVSGIYLLYMPLPEWWYLRFLMPALAVALVLTSVVAANVLKRVKMGGLLPILAVLVGILWTREAGTRDAFALQAIEGRYRQSARMVVDRLPPNAVLITEWESGSIRFHADRDVVLWRGLDPSWLERGVDWLRSQGLQPYFLFERGEERQFRDRFREQSGIGALDWPPRFDYNRQVRIYDPADRARFLSGESYATENLR